MNQADIIYCKIFFQDMACCNAVAYPFFSLLFWGFVINVKIGPFKNLKTFDYYKKYFYWKKKVKLRDVKMVYYEQLCTRSSHAVLWTHYGLTCILFLGY